MRSLSPLLLCVLLLACSFLAPHVRAQDSSSTGEGVPTGDSSTGTVAPTESSSSGGGATPTNSSSSSSTGSADPSSTGSDSGSTGGGHNTMTGRQAPTSQQQASESAPLRPSSTCASFGLSMRLCRLLFSLCVLRVSSSACTVVVSNCVPPTGLLSPDHFVCGCQARVNRTTETGGPDRNETETKEVDSNTYYVGGPEWDLNAETSATPWDNSLESGNQQSNRIDIVNNHDLTDFTSKPGQPVKIRGYPQCYGSTRSCLEQYDLAKNPKKTGLSGELFCEKGGGEAPKFIKGDPSPPICLVFGGGNRLNKMRFYPKVDQFALLTIQDSFNGSTVGSTINALRQLGHFGTTFQVELNGKQSPYRHRYGMVTSQECVSVTGADGKPDYSIDCAFTGGSVCTVVPFHTIVIHLKQGELDFIEWDDDDSLCNNDHSVDGNCAIEINECRGGQSYSKTNTATSTDCDFKIYVSWAGTDSEGTYLSSSGRRLSQFRRWSLNAVYNQATSFDVGTLPTLPPEE